MLKSAKKLLKSKRTWELLWTLHNKHSGSTTFEVRSWFSSFSVFLELHLIKNFEFSYGPYLLTIELIEVAQKLSFIEIWLWATSQHWHSCNNCKFNSIITEWNQWQKSVFIRLNGASEVVFLWGQIHKIFSSGLATF